MEMDGVSANDIGNLLERAERVCEECWHPHRIIAANNTEIVAYNRTLLRLSHLPFRRGGSVHITSQNPPTLQDHPMLQLFRMNEDAPYIVCQPRHTLTSQPLIFHDICAGGKGLQLTPSM